MAVAGLVLTAQQAAGVVGALGGGVLFDRLGGRALLLSGAGLSAAALAATGLDGTLAVFVVAATVVGLTTGVVLACLNALAPHAWAGAGRHAFNVVYVAFNVGVAAGPVLAGVLAGVSFSLAFAVGALVLAAFCALIGVTYRGTAFAGVTRTGEAALPGAFGHALNGLVPGIWVLALGMALDWVVYSQWLTVVPAYVRAAGLPIALYSVLWTVNGVLIVAGQPLLQRVVRAVPNPTAQTLLGTGLFVAGFSLLAAWRAYPAYLAAMTLSTAGEMLVWPAVPATADALAPPRQRGAVQGLISMAGFGGRTLGPIMGGVLYGALPAGLLFLALTALLLLAGLAYASSGRLPVRSPSPQH